MDYAMHDMELLAMETYRRAVGRVRAWWSCPHQLAARDDVRRVRSGCSQLLVARGSAARRAAVRGVAARCTMLMMRVLARMGAAARQAGCRCSLIGVPLLAVLSYAARCSLLSIAEAARCFGVARKSWPLPPHARR
ncbi:hypothetical protein Dimus_030050 [Dionaea muscipula]